MLCCPFADLDAMIEDHCGCPVPEIFSASGEAEFRRIEKEILKDVLETSETRQCAPEDNLGMILALGGGAVMTPECEKMVHERTFCVYLRASVDELVTRLSSETAGRPLLDTALRTERAETSALRARIQELMSLRSSTYERVAHHIVDTDGKTIDDIAQEIRNCF